jgi:Ca2+-transporting ATPase
MAAWLIFLIRYGTDSYGGLAAGSTMAITAFALFRIVCAYECRSELATIFGVETFDNRQLNLVVLVELVLAWLVTEFDALHRLLGTTTQTAGQWAIEIGAALTLLVAWEIGKLAIRRLAPEAADAGGRAIGASDVAAASPA